MYPIWSAQKNDLCGGWVVTNYHHPLSQHDFRFEGDHSKRGYVIADCMTEKDAQLIADLLNEIGTIRELPPQRDWRADSVGVVVDVEVVEGSGEPF